MSTVDVVIPCYNYARYLEQCVDSVLSQPGVDVRVLIIDDASSDETLQVGQNLVNADSRVAYRRHTKNKGHIATYNEGLIGWATADYIVLLSADDLLSPGSLSRAVGLMESDPNVGMVYGSTFHFECEADIPKTDPGNFGSRRWTGGEWLQLRCRAGYNVITSPEVVVRGSVQRAVGGYRPELPHTGDLEMWLRVAAVSDVAYISRVPQAFYRVHSKSMMRTIHSGSILDLHQRKAAFDSFFSGVSPAMTDASHLCNLANRSLAREALWDACRAYDRNDIDISHAGELVEFALTTYSKAASLGEYGALLRRRRLGPFICNRTQVFAVPALIRKLRRAVLKCRWKRYGV
jgi:glycosyltransferase involved in cell wall biosynthesis